LAQAGRFRSAALAGSVSAAVVLCGVSLSWSGGGWSAVLPFWAVLAGEELWGWRRWAASRQGSPRGMKVECPPAENVWQQFTLSRDEDGTARLAGWLRVPLAAGQRTGAVHVAFCPPFRETPEVAWEQTDGPEARIRAAQVLPYGARLDLKLAAAAEESGSVVLRFTASEGAGKDGRKGR
jgi:hypothetical protein